MEQSYESGYGTQSKKSRMSRTRKSKKTYSKKPYNRSQRPGKNAATYSTTILRPAFNAQKTSLHILRTTALIGQYTGIVTNDPNPKFGSFSWKLNMFYNYTTLLNNYDTFAFKWIRATFTRLQQTADDTNTGDCTVLLHVVPDFDDDNTPAATQDIQARPYYKQIPISDCDKPTSMLLTPKCTAVVAKGFSSTSLAGETRKGLVWLNTTADGADTAHYGLKYALEQYAKGVLTPTGSISDNGIHVLFEAGILCRGETRI